LHHFIRFLKKIENPFVKVGKHSVIFYIFETYKGKYLSQIFKTVLN